MEELIITDEPDEKLEIKYDKERFAITHHFLIGGRTIILNKREAKEIANFIKERLAS